MQDQIILLGTGTARSSLKRYAPGSLLILQDIPLLIDIGPGIQRQLSRVQEIDLSDLNHVFLTHLHADHVSDLIILLKEYLMLERSKPFFVYGPEGTLEFFKILFTQAFSYLKRVFDFVQIQECEQGQILVINDVQVSVTPTIHSIPSIAYRFDTSLHSVVLSGDTAYSTSLIDLAMQSEYLIHECSYPDGIETDNHVTPHILGRIAQEAQVENLILTHFYPICEDKLNEIIRSIKKVFKGSVEIGEDLRHIHI